MILTLSLSLSVFVGGVALLSQLVDACGGGLPFSLLTPIAALVAIWAACSRLRNSERPPIRVEIEGLLVAGGAALALLAFPGFGVRPMALSWDGANHLAIIRYLAEHLTHRGLIDTSYINSLGGSISSYPWGWHAFMAGVSSISGMDLLQMVQATLVSSAALAVALVHVKGRRSGLASLPALAVALPVLVLYRFTFELNQWSFSTAIFQMVTLLVCWERLGENPLMNTLLAVSAAVVHPLVIPVLILGIFLAGRRVRTGGLRSPILPVLSLVLLAAFLLLPSLGAQKVRAMEGYGPVLWVDGMAVLIVGIAYSLVLLVPSGLKGFRGTANHSFFWASLAGVVASWGLGLTPYWISKYLYLSFFLVAAGTDHGLVRRLGERLQSGLAMVVLVSVLWMIAKFSQSAVFGENDMALAKILATSETSKARVYVLADPYRMAWMQSFVYPARLLRPENFRRLAVSFANRADPPSFLAIFKELGSSGDHLWTLLPDEIQGDRQFRFETAQFGWTQFVYQGAAQP